MPRTITPLLFILFPLVLYFLWPSWPDLVDSIIAWGREHPLVWTPLIRMYLSHLESLVKTTKPYPQFEEVCSLYSLLLIDTKEEKNSKKKRIFYTFCENPQLSLSSAPQPDDHVCIVGAGPAGYFAREILLGIFRSFCVLRSTINFKGIHMALSLKDKGFSDVVIFER